MSTRFLMNSRKEKAMKAFGMGGYKRGGHVTEISIILGMPKGLKHHGMDNRHKMPVKKAEGGQMDSENPQVEQYIDSANKILGRGVGLNKGGKVNNGRVKKSIGGEIQKASIMGLPGYLMNQAADAFKKGGKIRAARKADGGTVGLSQMSNRDFNSGKDAMGLRRGGDVKSRSRKADGGVIDSYVRPVPTYGKTGLPGLGLKRGGDVLMAAGGAGKIRHHQMSKSGKPIKPSSCRNH